MALTEKQWQGRYPNTSNNTLVSAIAASTTLAVTVAHMCNTTASDVEVRLFYVPSGDSADQSTAMLYDFVIPANDYHSFSPEKPHYIETGGTVVFYNGTSNGVTITLSGVEIT